MTPQYRQPTVPEAVAWLMQQTDLAYRRLCLKTWGEQFGQTFRQEVEAQFSRKWKGRKRG